MPPAPVGGAAAGAAGGFPAPAPNFIFTYVNQQHPRFAEDEISVPRASPIVLQCPFAPWRIVGDDAILPGHLATSLVIPAMCISQDAADGVVRDSANLVESSLTAPAVSRAAIGDPAGDLRDASRGGARRGATG